MAVIFRCRIRRAGVDSIVRDHETVVLLPGLDGTGTLLEPFAAVAPPEYEPRIVRYPPDRVLTFDEYVELAAAQIGEGDLVVAESFSGPIAIRIAATKAIGALVLVSTFVVSPLPRVLRFAPITTLARLQVPDWLLTFWLLAPYATREAIAAAHASLSTLDSRVLASRIRIALMTDECASLARTRMPLIDIHATGDRLVWRRERPRILAARPDAQFADIEGPHGLLLTRPREVWSVLGVQSVAA